MTTIVKAAGGADFLGLVPQMLGYQPTESVLIIPFGGSRTIGLMRFDMPNVDNWPSFGLTTLGLACRVDGADGIAIVVYSHQPVDDVTGLARALTASAHVMGLRVVDALYVTDKGWGSTIVDDGPHPLSEIQAESVLPVREGDQSTIVDPVLDEAVVNQCWDAIVEIATTEDELDSVAHFIDGLASQGGTLTGSDLAWLGLTMARPSHRDIGLVTITGGLEAGCRGEEAQSAWEQGEGYPTDLAKVMWGEGPRPDTDRLENMLAHAHAVASIGLDPDVTAGAYAACAWLAWALGRSTHAETYARRAIDVVPEHGLSEIVLSFVQAGHLPDWAFRTNQG